MSENEKPVFIINQLLAVTDAISPPLPIPPILPLCGVSLCTLCCEVGKHAGRVFRSLSTHFTFLLPETLGARAVFTSSQQQAVVFLFFSLSPSSSLCAVEQLVIFLIKPEPLEASSVNSWSAGNGRPRSDCAVCTRRLKQAPQSKRVVGR